MVFGGRGYYSFNKYRYVIQWPFLALYEYILWKLGWKGLTDISIYYLLFMFDK